MKHKVLSLVLVVLLLLVSIMTLARASFLWDLGFMAGYHQGNMIGYTSGVTDGYRLSHHRRPLHITSKPEPESTPPAWMYHHEEEVNPNVQFSASSRLTAS